MLKPDPHSTYPSTRKKPSFRQVLIRKQHIGEDPLVDIVLTKPDSLEARMWPDCEELFNDRIQRGYVESAILTGESDEVIAEIFEMKTEFIKLYRETCFDLSRLNRLEKIALLDKEKEKDVLVMKLWAMTGGLDFIRWRLGHKVEINPLTGLVELFTMCYNKSREAIFNPNSSQASIESTKWVKLSMDIARLLKLWTSDNDQARKDLEVAIKSVVPNFKSLDDILAEEEARKQSNSETPTVDVDTRNEQIIEEIVKNDDHNNS
jgi:hypothetical protein